MSAPLAQRADHDTVLGKRRCSPCYCLQALLKHERTWVGGGLCARTHVCRVVCATTRKQHAQVRTTACVVRQHNAMPTPSHWSTHLRPFRPPLPAMAPAPPGIVAAPATRSSPRRAERPPTAPSTVAVAAVAPCPLPTSISPVRTPPISPPRATSTGRRRSAWCCSLSIVPTPLSLRLDADAPEYDGLPLLALGGELSVEALASSSPCDACDGVCSAVGVIGDRDMCFLGRTKLPHGEIN